MATRRCIPLIFYLILRLPFLASAAIDCRICPPQITKDVPSVGFDLTSAYGVSSVQFRNGTIKDLAKVEAPQEYKDLMVRLSTAPKPEHRLFPIFQADQRWLYRLLGYSREWDKTDYSFLECLRRYYNRRQGRPSTPDVGILGDLLARLKTATETELGIPIEQVVLTHPPFPALTISEIIDALEYAGLPRHNSFEYAGLPTWSPARSHAHLPMTRAKTLLPEPRAAFAAHGLGTEPDFDMPTSPRYPTQDGSPLETVYFVSLTRTALYTTMATDVGGCTCCFAWCKSYVFDANAGLDHANEPGYWAYVRDRLHPKNIDCDVTNDNFSHILLSGEAAEVPEFQDALRNALSEAALPEVIDRALDVESVPPLYASARGAAVYARKWQDDSATCWVPLSCIEKEDEERQRAARQEKGLSLYVNIEL